MFQDGSSIICDNNFSGSSLDLSMNQGENERRSVIEKEWEESDGRKEEQLRSSVGLRSLQGAESRN